jgi:hypothetical protein
MGLSTSRRAADLALVVAFAGGTVAPLARSVLGPPCAAVSSEFRRPAPLPPLGLQAEQLWELPARFEAFYNDRFGFRGSLIQSLSALQVRWLAHSSTAKVTVGKRGWLFSSELPGGPDHRAARPFTTEDLERWRRVLEARRDWLARRGIRYLFVVAPNKQSIYPEDLPRGLRRQQAAGSRVEQLVAHLAAHSDVPVLDLRRPLLAAKAGERVYDQTDTHWNDRGGYVGYRAILEALAPAFPVLAPRPRADFESVVERRKGGDLARMLSLDDQLPEEYLGLARRTPWHVREADAGIRLPPGPQPFAFENDDPGLPRAVFLCDSFTTQMYPFLSEHFRRVVYLWQMAFPTFETQFLERERPDVVIQEMVERKLLLGVPDGREPDTLAGCSETWFGGRP